MRRSNRDAFTLIELLAVVGVIGILAALLVSSVVLGKRKAQQILCSSNLHQLGLALHACVVDDHAYPTCPFWMDKLQDEGMGISTSIGYGQKGVWKCPSTQFYHGYGYNAYAVLNGEHPPEYWNAQALGFVGHGQSIPRAPIRESEVVNPSDMMAIGDSFDNSAELMRYSLEYYRCPPRDLPEFTDRLTRHRGKANGVL
jgi:prepilin-type N-terminal cleavage/methylation domain-containing protein